MKRTSDQNKAIGAGKATQRIGSPKVSVFKASKKSTSKNIKWNAKMNTYWIDMWTFMHIIFLAIFMVVGIPLFLSIGVSPFATAIIMFILSALFEVFEHVVLGRYLFGWEPGYPGIEIMRTKKETPINIATDIIGNIIGIIIGTMLFFYIF